MSIAIFSRIYLNGKRRITCQLWKENILWIDFVSNMIFILFVPKIITLLFYKLISSKISFYSITYNITRSSSENFPCFFHYKYPVSFIWIEKIACTSWSQCFYFFEKYFTNCYFFYRQNTFFSFVIILVLLIFFVKYSVWHRSVQLAHQNHPNSYYHDV
jgi:hypothetical protein